MFLEEDGSAFHQAASPPKAFACPELRSLELAQIRHHPVPGIAGREPADDRIIVAPEDIRTFIRTSLLFSAAQLDSLSFRGVDLLTSVPAELSALLDSVVTVTVDDVRCDNPFGPSREWSNLGAP